MVSRRTLRAVGLLVLLANSTYAMGSQPFLAKDAWAGTYGWAHTQPPTVQRQCYFGNGNWAEIEEPQHASALGAEQSGPLSQRRDGGQGGLAGQLEPMRAHTTQVGGREEDIVLNAYGRFRNCMTGPIGPVSVLCECFDHDGDSDVDLVDFARFQVVFEWSLCQLANPSFEEFRDPLAGWHQLGTVSASSEMVSHGHFSAEVTGASDSEWSVSGLWQSLDAEPGERWIVSVDVGHRSANPLSGETRAILNVEWHTGDGMPPDYESYVIADENFPLGQMMPISPIEVGPAPDCARTLHMLLGVLQSPDTPPAHVFFDLAKFAPVDVEQIQWCDFSERRIDFSGRRWRVKGPGYYGPGPNHYSDSECHVWVDKDHRLHMTIRNVGDLWYSTEIAAEVPLGYGDYIITTVGRLDTWDPNVVFGQFLWQYSACYDPATFWWNPNNEIDIEFSRFGEPKNLLGHFVVKPDDQLDSVEPFPATFIEGELTSHAFRWLPDCVEFRSWRGGPGDEAIGPYIHTWTYTGSNIPRPEEPRHHINFWHLGNSPWSWTDQELVIDAFTFVPAP